MRGKLVGFLLITALFATVSCGSGAKDVPQPPQVIPQTGIIQPAEPVVTPPAPVEQPVVVQQVEVPPVEVVQTPPPVVEAPPPVVQTPPPVVEVFDPNRITQEHYASTLDDVRDFIEELNTIIRNRNYNAWRAALSVEHFEEISSPENLQYISEQPAMTTRRIILRSAEDYFTHVVVPSRANSRVDDIEFISMNRVKAFTVNTNRAGDVQRLRLYDLEKIGNSWKIIN